MNCSVCPAVFTTTMCAGQYFTYYMCIGNAYTISMCGATTTWDSYLAITTTNGTTLATGSTAFDDDGCGTTDGHASLTFIPAATGTYRALVAGSLHGECNGLRHHRGRMQCDPHGDRRAGHR
ncbi:MAG: hypothetical protein IPL52_17860 [Flavobacteriales bacterium]|nr:hypothetical protein [Flavobacteriales bacterium]